MAEDIRKLERLVIKENEPARKQGQHISFVGQEHLASRVIQTVFRDITLQLKELLMVYTETPSRILSFKIMRSTTLKL